MVLNLASPRAALLLALCGGTAAGLAAQDCGPGRRVEADLGIGGLDCLSCTVHASDTTTPGWIGFGAEPTLRQIHAGGPADGRLRDGDVLVAVAGLPVTTEAAGRRFAGPAIGKPLSITVRRDGRELTYDIVPVGRCAEVERHAAAPSIPPPPRPDAGADRGWLGIALSCSWCSSADQPDGTALWSFSEYPELVAVDPSGPARRVGLQPGDSIRAIDGVSLIRAEGGRRFGAVRPGDRVRLTISRNGVEHTVTVTATRRHGTP